MPHLILQNHHIVWRELKSKLLAAVSFSKSQLLFDFLALNDIFEYQAVKYSDQLNKIMTDMLEQLERGYPFEYIVGECYFSGLQLKVTQDTLIPRFDSECLVEYAANNVLADIPANESYPVLDLGTGSGALAIALAYKFPEIHFTGTDISPEALAIAMSNAQRYGCKNIEYIVSDWGYDLKALYALVVCNPPYLSEREWQMSPPLHFEPKSTLVASGSARSSHQLPQHATDCGVDCYYALLDSIEDKLISGGNIILEHGYSQAELVQKVLQTFGYNSIQRHTDISGVERMTTAIKG